MKGDTTADRRVAIVGAGAAGLAAARMLTDGGIAPLVLEARDRIGGRACTVLHDGLPLDHGCGWLHSADRNEWVDLARAMGLTVDSTPSPWRRQYRNLNFSEEDQAAFRAASDEFYERIEEAAEGGEDGPAADWLPPGGRWNGLMDAISSYYNGAELDRVSIVDYDRYVDTGSNWRVREGLGTAVATFGAAVPVRLACPVTVIEHAGRSLRLHTPKGIVEVDRAIITLPPSVLARGSGPRFDPPLPDKEAAAAGLPLGIANKMFFRVTDPAALPAEAHAFGRTDRAGTASYHFQPFGRPVVEGYFGGRCAAELERAGAAAFAAFALDELAGLLGARVRKVLAPLACTAWAEDPWAFGSYSHALPGHADDRARWAAPVDGRLFFAGEACSRHDFSTVHGALRSGRAAARALLDTLSPALPGR